MYLFGFSKDSAGMMLLMNYLRAVHRAIRRLEYLEINIVNALKSNENRF